MPCSLCKITNTKEMVLSMELPMTLWPEWILHDLIYALFFYNIEIPMLFLNYKKIQYMKKMAPHSLLATRYLR